MRAIAQAAFSGNTPDYSENALLVVRMIRLLLVSPIDELKEKVGSVAC